jgi:hypothetical protein
VGQKFDQHFRVVCAVRPVGQWHRVLVTPAAPRSQCALPEEGESKAGRRLRPWAAPGQRAPAAAGVGQEGSAHPGAAGVVDAAGGGDSGVWISVPRERAARGSACGRPVVVRGVLREPFRPGREGPVEVTALVQARQAVVPDDAHP